jgi:hypothetical protein
MCLGGFEIGNCREGAAVFEWHAHPVALVAPFQSDSIGEAAFGELRIIEVNVDVRHR